MNGRELLTMDLEMIVPVAIDWDKDGDFDLICGDEDGRVAFIEHTGEIEEGLPLFNKPVYFQQRAKDVKFGALATPFGVDWDSDGDEDIICGNTAGYIGFFENLGGGENPKWDGVKFLKAGGHTIRIQAGPNGSIQGPAEAKWGYTTQTVADWDHDGLLDIVVNSIWGKIIWYRNIGVLGKPLLDGARPINVAWPGKTPKPAWNWWDPVGDEFVTQWRTTPMAIDWNRDGLTDIVMLDHEGFLAFFERAKKSGQLRLLPGKRIFVDETGQPLKLIRGPAGGSGRRKLEVTDWDGDGRLDILFNGENADFYRNLGEQDGKVMLKNMGTMDARKVSGHTSSPTLVDWDKNGIPDLLVGSEDGRLYYKLNPREKGKPVPMEEKGNFHDVPGSVVDHSPISSELYMPTSSLLKMPNGDYIASHDYGSFQRSEPTELVEIFRSSDGGKSWQHISTTKGRHSSLFRLGNTIYHIGALHLYGPAMIQKSTDEGLTWTLPVNEKNGLLDNKHPYHSAGVPVVVHNGRIWRGFEVANGGHGNRPKWTVVVFSAPIDSDLLDASNWTISEPIHHEGKWQQWIEGNMVVTPEGELVNILRANGRDPGYAVMVHVSGDGKKLAHDPKKDVIEFPGGGSKFAIRYDSESGRFWSLVNKQKNPAAKRNVLVLSSSENLRDWTVHETVFNHPDAENISLHYVDFQIDGNDIVFTARTSWPDGMEGPLNYHDNNFVTFHRLKNFRTDPELIDPDGR
jgi:hypothetical protein